MPEASRYSGVGVDGQQAAQHLVGRPAHRGDGGDAQPLVDLGAARVVDAGDHLRTPNVSRATRAARMLELSPLLTAAKAYASSMPASSRVSRSKPTPTTRRPSNRCPGAGTRRGSGRRRRRCGRGPPRAVARVEPVRPHPMITKCTRSGSSTGAGCSRGDAPTVHARAPHAPPWCGRRAATTRRLACERAAAHRRRQAPARGAAGPFRAPGETLLPKRIALPVFASDALSSVAYAPDEIFLTLAVAGVAAYAASPWIGLAVVFVMLIVVASTGRTCTPTPRAAATTRWPPSTWASGPA